MPSPDPEPENYSIDDMMDRLRSRGEGGSDGELQLVTRDDGTQVYRMRKRKRRSQQPKKDKERRKKQFRVVQVVLAVGLVAVTAAAFLAAVLYLNSGAYRDRVMERIRTWTGGEPKITELRVTPVGVAASSLELKWTESSALDSLKLGRISGDLRTGSLLTGKWKGNELYSATGGTLVLRMPTGGKSKATGGQQGQECPFHFRYRSSKFSVLSGDPAKPVFRVRDSEASLVMKDATANVANLQLEGGSLQVAGWGEYGMSFASLQFENGTMRVGGLRFVPAGGGKGEIRMDNPGGVPFDLDGGTSELDVRLAQLPLDALLGPSFGTWLSATVETPEGGEAGKFSIKAGSKPEMSLRVPFEAVSSTDTEAGGLPMFEVLANHLQEPWYQRPRFDLEAGGEAVKSGAGTGVENLNLEARGRLILKGGVLAKQDGSLEGTLEVGLPAAGVATATPELRAVFSRKAGGYLWASVKVSGNSRDPQDNLEAQLGSSAATVSPAEGGNEALEDAFRDLTTPAPK
jgi:hypothetical protein